MTEFAAAQPQPAVQPLAGVKVVDIATLGAGPWLATRLADFGADVIKVEHPEGGDPLRHLGWFDKGVSLWWKADSRNKRCITLDLKKPEGKRILKQLVRDADVLVENFRPGTLEKWDLGYDVLSIENPRLVMVRVTGWGQNGPYSDRPGFGALAEGISGWAHLNGFPDGPPTLPPFSLGDTVTSIIGAFATMIALYHRDALGGGKGQVIDISIYESLFSLIGQQVIVYDRLGVVPERTGNAIPTAAPRNVYATKDQRFVALAASTPTIFERVALAIGHPELIGDPRFKDNKARIQHREELDRIIGNWMAEHTLKEVIDTFEAHEAAIAPVYDIAQIFQDPHYQARQVFTSVDDPELGPTLTCNVFPRFSDGNGRVRHLGPAFGEHTEEVLCGLGYTREQIDRLRDGHVI